MRIGIVVNNVEYVYGLMSGGHRHAFFVAHEWTAHELTFFACYDAVAYLRATFPQARVVRLPSIEPYSRARIPALLSRMLLAPLRLRELRSCDVVLASSHYLADVIPAALARRGRAVVTVWHAVDAPLARGGGTLVSMLMWASERCALAIARRCFGGALGGTSATLARVRLPRDGAIAAIACNGVDHALASEARAARDAPPAYDAVFVGRVHPTKRVHDAIEAWAEVVRHRPGARLAIVGPTDATYLRALHAGIERLGLVGNVVFRGEVNEREKFAALADARVFVFPSVEEGWGIVLAEAGAVGRPCVTYDLPVFREVFPEGRRAVPPDDVRGLAREILDLLNDESAADALGAAGRRQAEAFTWARAAHIEAELLQRVRDAAKRPYAAGAPMPTSADGGGASGATNDEP